MFWSREIAQGRGEILPTVSVKVLAKFGKILGV